MSNLIRQAVLDKWHEFSEPLEGRIRHPYLDILGLVTTGVGNLIDDRKTTIPKSASSLPWRAANGALMSQGEVKAQWEYLKSRQDLKSRHYKYAKDALELRFGHAMYLTDEAIDELVERRLNDFATHATKVWPEFPSFPADAQLGLLSGYWALGSWVNFPNMRRLVNAQDWAGCAEGAPADEKAPGWGTATYPCKIKDSNNPGVRPRNQRNVKCFRNAADVVASDLDLAVLHWPDSVYTQPKAPIGYKTLRVGDKGDEVKLLQRKLGLKDDGDFGPKTHAAVVTFQQKNGLVADGVVGSKTWSMLP